jgi:hypothetical protein
MTFFFSQGSAIAQPWAMIRNPVGILVSVHGPSIVELLGYSCDFSARKGTDTSRSGTRSLASVPFLLRFFKVVKVGERYLPVNGYRFFLKIIYLYPFVITARLVGNDKSWSLGTRRALVYPMERG